MMTKYTQEELELIEQTERRMTPPHQRWPPCLAGTSPDSIQPYPCFPINETEGCVIENGRAFRTIKTTTGGSLSLVDLESWDPDAFKHHKSKGLVAAINSNGGKRIEFTMGFKYTRGSK